MLTLTQAAKEAGVSTTTLRRAIKDGRIFAVRNAKGHMAITWSELHRAFPGDVAINTETDDAPSDDAQSDELPATDERADVEDLCGKLGLMAEQLSEARTQLDDWQRHSDHSVLDTEQLQQAAE